MLNHKVKLLTLGAVLSLALVLALPWLQGNFNNTSAAPLVCGDGILVEPQEECDDGNTTDGDGCSSLCVIEAVCGDSTVHYDKGEYCDDGGTASDDGCSNICEIEPVGCYWTFDELPASAGGYTTDAICSMQCSNTKNPFGMAGFIGGYAINNAGCVCVGADFAACEDPVTGVCNNDGLSKLTNVVCNQVTCGDGTVDTGEACDDSNLVDGDGCSSRCQTETCGNNVINIGEDCDDGNTTNGDGCSNTCVDEYNGCYLNTSKITVQSVCNDSVCGNNGYASGLILGNGFCLCYQEDQATCDTLCTSYDQFDCGYLNCGNGIVENGEECDGGYDYTTCDKYCQRVPVCGDGYIDSPEQCDDSNTTSGDGCDSSCKVEGTLFEHEAGSQVCDDFDGNESTVCLWREGAGVSYVNNKVGNDSPFDHQLDTGAIEWHQGKCSVAGGVKAHPLLSNLVINVLLAYAEDIPQLNWFVSIFVDDVHAKAIDLNATMPGQYTCLHVKDSDNYYDIYWTGYSNTDDSFSYIRSEFIPVCGNSAKEAGEQCDDGNKLNGDGCNATCGKEQGRLFSYAGGGTASDGDELVNKSVTIWRGTSSPVFNANDGADYSTVMNNTLSTIEWAKGTCASPTSSYNDDVQTSVGNTMAYIVGERTCLHLKTEDYKYDVLWNGYEQDFTGQDGGFSYYRWLYDTAAPVMSSITAEYRTGTVLLSMSKVPYDNGGGKLTRCVAKYADTQIATEDDWNNAIKIYDKVNPLDECFSGGVRFYAPGSDTKYYAVRVYDDSNNISNIVSTTSGLVIPSKPEITELSPATGANNQAVTVTVTGDNFDTGGKPPSVKLTGSNNFLTIRTVTLNSTTELEFDIPAGIAPGDYKVLVLNDYGISAANVDSIYTATASEVAPLPVVHKMYPSVGSVNSDVDITIKGENFTSATALYLSDSKTTVAIAGFTVVSDNEIAATIPSGALSPRSFGALIETPNGTNVYAPPLYIPYSDVSITPTDTSSAQVRQGETASFSGFSGEDSTELAQDLALLNTTSQVSNNVVVTNITANIAQGTKITNSAGAKYTGIINPPRVVDKEEVLASSVFDKLGDKSVIIEMGNPTEKINFDTDFVVTVDLTADVQPIIWYYNRSTEEFELAGKEGFKDSVHFYPGGVALTSVVVDGETIWTMGFLTDHMSAYVAGVTPAISSLSPTSGQSGSSVSITGTNFHTNATVTIGGQSATASYIDTEHLTATIPTLSAGSHDVIVTNPDLLTGTSTFTVTVPAVVSVGGSTVVVSSGGGGLSGGASVVPTREQLLEEAGITEDESTSEVEIVMEAVKDVVEEVTLRRAAPSIQRVVSTVKTALNDITDHWARVYIKRLYNVDIVSGKTEGIFAPNDPITRAELTKIALNTFFYSTPEATTSKPFEDVDTDSWYAPYAKVAKDQGILSGFQGNMRPNEVVTRAEALKILIKASNLPVAYSTDKIFTDTNPNAWYMKYIRFAYENGIVSGHADGSFKPGSTVTRAEVAKMTVNLLDLYLDN